MLRRLKKNASKIALIINFKKTKVFLANHFEVQYMHGNTNRSIVCNICWLAVLKHMYETQI